MTRSLLIRVMVALTCFAAVAPADTIDLDARSQIRAFQSGVLEVDRDFFRRGYWRWNWQYPIEDRWAKADQELTFSLPDLPEDSTVTSAEISWQFSNWNVQNAGASYGNDLYGPPERPSAKRPRCKGIGCRVATIERFESSGKLMAASTHVNGDHRPVPADKQLTLNGSLDLLSVYGSDALDDGGSVALAASVFYSLGRPFFGTEGRNAMTQFDVNGWAEVDVSARLRMTFETPPPPPVENTPEPNSMALMCLGTSAILLGRFARQRI